MNSFLLDITVLFSLAVGLILIGFSIKKSFQNINSAKRPPNINSEDELLSVERREIIQELLALSIAKKKTAMQKYSHK